MMAEDGGNLSGDPGVRDTEGLSPVPRTFIRLNDLSGPGGEGGVEHSEMEPVSAGSDGAFAAGEEASAGGEDELPHPTLAPIVFFYLKQTTPPRSWCLKMLSNVFLNSCVSTWFERASMLVILLNCSERCKILEDFDDFIFAFFAVEMVIKMVALGIFGKKRYLGDTWNRLDFFIVLAGMLEYSLNLQNVSFSAVRTVRVLRPLRAINRVPSMRILVTLLLDTLPMLGNVLLLCFFVFFIFGIVGVQLWAGLLRNRCFLPENFSLPLSIELETYYHTENDDESPFICSMPRENGMRLCSSVPTLYDEGGLQCQMDMKSYNSTDNTTCINWNQYYSNCSAGHINPFKGAINFDNICYAWIAIFQVITLEGWVDIMYFVMDSHSFYNFIYFILLIIIGSFFMINLCLVVIATQFSETKQRESQLMREQRIRFLSNASTLASFSEPGSCYDELLKLLVHVIHKGFRQVAHVCRAMMRRAGMNIAASPPALERERERGSQRKRRKTSRQGSVVSTKGAMSVHYMVHQHHHHHYHYHLVNGSVRGRLGGRGVAGVGVGGGEVEMGSHSNNGGTGRLMLGPLQLPTSDLNLANPVSPANPALGTGSGNSSSVRSTLHTDCHLEPSTPTLLAPTPFSLAPTPMSRPMKRNSVPFAGPRPKNYPTLQPSTLMEFRSGSVTANTISNINLNIPPLPLERGPPSLSPHDPSAIGTLDPSFTLDPESCPYCVKALSGESEGTDGNETPRESDSEGVYEFTLDLHHRDRRDRRDSRQPRKRQRKLGTTVGRVVRAWRLVCDTFRKIVDSKYFGRGIMIAILINTLSMGIEYHEQPDELTNALEISNIVFTSLFALEMLLKVLVYGPFGYIKNPYNIFDGVIVVISVWEIVGQQGGGLSVLRTFRLMRVLKLVRFMPALQRQLVVLMKTMDNVATFCMLLMLFIFIFSILGMHLFGCKFGSERDGDTLPDRKNFDTLLWAIVTVFQILTQEDWNKVLYNGMASTTPVAALYFIALMTFGNYVLFNLLVAILVEGFQTEGEDSKSVSEADLSSRSMEDMNGSGKDASGSPVVPINGHVDLKTSLTPPLITHTAATPMPVPKLPTVVDPALGCESRHGSNVSMDLACYDKSPTSARSTSPYAPWSSASGWTSRRSSWNSVGRAPSLKRTKRQSGERRSLLSGEGGSSSEDDEGGGGGTSEGDDVSLCRTDSMSQSQHQHRRMESVETRESIDLAPDILLQVPFLYRSASIHSSRPPSLGGLRAPERSDCNGKGTPAPGGALAQTQLSLEDNTEDEAAEEEVVGRVARLSRWLERKQPEWCRKRDTWSLYILPPDSRFRMACNKIISHKMFDHIVLVIIFLNCITIAMERPRIEAYSVERIFLTLSNYIFTAIFVAEMTVKVAALGWLFGDKAYLRSSWNLLDGLLVMISAIDILVSLVSNSSPKILGMLRVLRLLRTLRPLRVISRAPGLKLVVETLMSSLKPIGNIVVICCAFFIIFGILGVQLFKGKFFACQGEDVRNVTNKSDCMMANYKWVRQQYNFDNLAQALMSLFVLASKDGWVDIMYDGLDAVGVNQQPQLNHNPWMLLYFISFLLIVSFFVLNMFVGVVVENFHKCRRSQEAEEAKRREEKRLKRMEKKRRSKEKEMAGRYVMFSVQFIVYFIEGRECVRSLYKSSGQTSRRLQKEAESLSVPQMESLDPGESLEDNLLRVRKSTVGRTHSLPNDCYMFLSLEPFGSPGASLAPGLASQTQTTGPQHIQTINKALSGTVQTIPLHTDTSIHTLSRTLRRQVSNDSQEVLCSDGGEEVVLHVASLSSSSSLPSHLHQQPALQLVPATPGASPQPSRPRSVHTQHPSSHSLPPPPLPPTHPWRQEEGSADQEVSLITRAGLAGIDDVIGVGLGSEDGGLEGSYKGYWVGRGGGQLKRFHSADTQGRSVLAPRSRPLSWLDDPHRHSVDVCSSVESSPQRSTTSSGFVSRADSLQMHSQTTTLPPDGLEPQSGLHPARGGWDTSCLRRRAPSSDSKDSFDLGVREGLGLGLCQEGGGSNPKLLTLLSFSFEKTSSEH
uniref:Voltage-dependent T-type calcium channel subunit alpha n=2 Tax=Oncorhynchus TaxID=8016 RepID=A0A8C7G282_ONCKI